MSGTRLRVLVGALGVVLAMVVVGPLTQSGPGDERIESGGPALRATDEGVAPVAELIPESTAVPTTTTVAPAAPTTVRAPATTTTVRGTVGAAPPVGVLPPTGPPVASPAVPVTPATTTSTTAVGCRNSTDPSCGPFRFDPQPGPDRPMTIEVVTEPASSRAGQEMVFRITLTDPDGVSYGSSLFALGDSGMGETGNGLCERYGPWTSPAPDPTHAVEVLTVRHTYAEAGTYQTSFTFDAGPFDCTDPATGRGDRPYASSARAALTVVVGG